MTYYYFFGVDVAKSTLAITVIKKGQILLQESILNEKQVFKTWLVGFKRERKIKAANILFCMENTGPYHELIVQVLTKAKIAVCVESSLRIKRSLGLQRGKNDVIDSERIARYAYINKERLSLWKSQRPIIQELKMLNALKKRLRSIILTLRLPVEERKKFSITEHRKLLSQICTSSAETLKKALLKTKQRIMENVLEDEKLSHLYKILTSIDGIGSVVAVELIIATNEFENFDSAKKFACYCGVAPFEQSSGTSVRGKTKVSKMANQRLKAILHLPAMSCIQMDNEIAKYYKRKVVEGCPKMSILNAVKYKLIRRVFACVKENRLYQIYQGSNIICNEKNKGRVSRF